MHSSHLLFAKTEIINIADFGSDCVCVFESVCLCVFVFRDHQHDIFNKLMFSCRLPHVAVMSSLPLMETGEGQDPATRETWVRLSEMCAASQLSPVEVTAS